MESKITYRGRVFEGKENFGIVQRTLSLAKVESPGENSVSIGIPCDFIDKQLAEFKGKDIEDEITVKISQK